MNKEEKQFNVIQVAELLIGHTDFWGESNYDSISQRNVKELELLVYELISKLIENYQLKDDYRASGKSLGQQAKKILLEIKYMLPSDLEEEREDKK